MPRYFKRTLFLAFLAAITVGSLAGQWAATRGEVVVFDANWCANCRDILPVVQDVASQNGLNVVRIDIDNQNAPKQARNYNLNIPSSDPPQVFYVDRGRTTLLYSGQNYKFGHSGAARATILQNLQRVLGAGASGN